METTDINTEFAIRDKSSLCYQCSKCSSGCPVAEEMDLLPHQVMHLASLGLEDRVLGSETIWICANCYACAVKCPNDINITAVMNDLKKKAVEQGYDCKRPEIYQFHKVFSDEVYRRGRVHELRIMGEYNLKIKAPFKNAELAPQMFMKNKLSLLPPKKIKGFKHWIRGIRSTDS